VTEHLCDDRIIRERSEVIARPAGRGSARFTIAIVALVALLLGILAVFSMRGGASGSRIEELAGLPVTLSPDDSSAAMGRLTLKEDGKATLQAFPIGTTRKIDDELCMEWDGSSTYTGTAEWRQLNGLMMVIESPDGEVVIQPYQPPRSDVVWYRFGISVCNDETMWYWTG